MNDVVDLLQIQIEKAKRKLPLETVNAIDSVDWKATILELRAKKGYTFEQLEILETETELLLCGLSSTDSYPKELEKRMGISRSETDELVNELNEKVFSKIREELIKNSERKKIFAQKEKEKKQDEEVLKEHGIEIIPTTPAHETPHNEITIVEIQPEEISGKVIEKPAETTTEKPSASILAQKLAGSFQTPAVKTDHSLENITKSSGSNSDKPNTQKSGYAVDPYRMLPE